MKKRLNVGKLVILIISLLGLVFYYLLLPYSSEFSSTGADKWVYILSVIGIIELIYIIHTWKLLTGKYITLYTLFMTFFFLFNYGQCLLWAFGIHSEGEIGTVNLYYNLSVPTSVEIVKTQLIVLISGLMLHLGAILFKKNKKNNINEFQLNYEENLRFSFKQNKIYKFCKLLAPIVVFSEYYTLLSKYRNAQVVGYTGLYYNPNVESTNVIFQILARLFLPVLLGLLIGSNYDKKIQRRVYGVFIGSVFLSLLIGDRGGWIYSLFILVISHNLFYKKITKKQLFLSSIILFILTYISTGIVEIRNSGVTYEGLISVITNFENNPIVTTISSIGASMGVTLALVMEGWNIFPYGNTFLYGLLTSPSDDLINILNLNYESLGSWFSQGYLGISNGAGFSIIAEVLLNFGPIFLPFFMFLFGIFIFWITDIEYKNPKTETVQILFCLITTAVTINISRNVFSYNIGEILYTTVQFLIYYKIYSAFSFKYHLNNRKLLYSKKELKRW